jgi:hypothetical protein
LIAISNRAKKRVGYATGAGGTVCGSPWSYTSVKYRAKKIEKNGATMRTRTQPMYGIKDRIAEIMP